MERPGAKLPERLDRRLSSRAMTSPIITFFDPQPIPSPCINICSMDGTYCEGCRRTLDEIARWTTMAPAERDRVMAELKVR